MNDNSKEQKLEAVKTRESSDIIELCAKFDAKGNAEVTSQMSCLVSDNFSKSQWFKLFLNSVPEMLTPEKKGGSKRERSLEQS